VFDFDCDGRGMGTLAYASMSGIGRGGTGVLKVDGRAVATRKMERTLPLILQWDENLDAGADTRTPVDDADFQVRFARTGKIDEDHLGHRPAATVAGGHREAEDGPA
jgi:arylsulfatase